MVMDQKDLASVCKMKLFGTTVLMITSVQNGQVVAHTMPNLFPTLESQQDIISTRTIERLSTIFPLDLMGNMRVSTLVYLFRANRSMLSVVISDLAKEGALASTCKNFSYY